MRKTCVLGGLIAALATMPAIAGSAYSKCVEVANPAQCIARLAAGSFGLESNEVLEAVLRHGLTDLVPGKSGKLIRGLYGEIGEPGAKMDSPEAQILDSGAAEALRKSPRKSLLAAMALVAAARHETDPFANPVYLKLAGQAKDDPRIPALALGMWIEVVGMSGSPPDFWVTHAGLPAIWDRAMARKEQDQLLLEDIAGTLAFLDELKPQAREFFLWYAKRPGLTPYQRVAAASRLARLFNLADDAASLMVGIGDTVEGYDVPGVRSSIAAARLEKGYDADAARIVMRAVFDSLGSSGLRFGAFSSFMSDERDALEHGGALNELRELGAECLRHAEATEGKPEAAEWYAAASDFYLRAGDRERAREIARRAISRRCHRRGAEDPLLDGQGSLHERRARRREERSAVGDR